MAWHRWWPRSNYYVWLTPTIKEGTDAHRESDLLVGLSSWHCNSGHLDNTQKCTTFIFSFIYAHLRLATTTVAFTATVATIAFTATILDNVATILDNLATATATITFTTTFLGPLSATAGHEDPSAVYISRS
mmetsp:Transcript_10331/g.25644  ORF Transcript_10331/g.25644 Transcript_10331/m.25644 type:complete len:132 (-) Transcript_10331:145-540(-)